MTRVTEAQNVSVRDHQREIRQIRRAWEETSYTESVKHSFGHSEGKEGYSFWSCKCHKSFQYAEGLLEHIVQSRLDRAMRELNCQIRQNRIQERLIRQLVEAMADKLNREAME